MIKQLLARFDRWCWTPKGRWWTFGADYRERLSKGKYLCPTCGHVHEFNETTELCREPLCHAPVCPTTGRCSARCDLCQQVPEGVTK